MMPDTGGKPPLSGVHFKTLRVGIARLRAGERSIAAVPDIRSHAHFSGR